MSASRGHAGVCCGAMDARRLSAALVVALAAACGSSDHEPDAHGGESTTCPSPERLDDWTLPLAKTSGAFTVTVESASPSPLVKGRNTLVVAVRDAAAAPVDGAAVALTPFMPDHGHGSTVLPTVRALGGGRYEVGDVVLPMAGLWELALAVTPPGGAEVRVVFVVCIDR